MPDACNECGGRVEYTVVSGIVSLKRRRSGMASGRVSALRAETCIECGLTTMYAERPERLFRDLHRNTPPS